MEKAYIFFRKHVHLFLYSRLFPELLPRLPAYAFQVHPIGGGGEKFAAGCSCLAGKCAEREEEHGDEGQAGADGCAGNTIRWDQEVSGRKKRREAYARTGGAVPDFSAANEIMAQDAVAAQGDDTR